MPTKRARLIAVFWHAVLFALNVAVIVSPHTARAFGVRR